MQNREVAHRFFYDLEGSFERNSMTVSYYTGKYYSYGTVIARITETIEGETVCIISDNNFSMTTAKHLNEKKAACPFRKYYLPQAIGNSDFYASEVVERLKNDLEYYSTAKLTQKANREGFSHTFKMLQDTLDLKMFESLFDKIKKLIVEYTDLFEKINNPEEIKNLKEIQQAREAEKQKRLKAELKEHIEKFDIAELAFLAYSNQTITDKDLKAKLRAYLNPRNDLSFVWFDNINDKIKTSQCISVNKKEGIALLKLWEAGKLKHGMNISCYTVLEVRENYIQIGCHKIPVENLKALLNQLKVNKAA